MRVLHVRARANPESLSGPVLKEIRAMDPDVPVADVRPMNQAIAGGVGFLLFRAGAIRAASGWRWERCRAMW
jgi:hypothetical protein